MHLPHDYHAVISGVLGATWLLGLWYAARVAQPVKTWSQQLAIAMALGCIFPLALGLINILYAWSLWVVLGAAVSASFYLSSQKRTDLLPAEKPAWDLVVGFGVLLALAWPIAVRPTLDGDTLIYHLPNAASWVTQHGVWATGTRYWWYPPASELFASGLLATGGVGAVGWAGAVPGVLMLFTFRDVAQRHGAQPIFGTLMACALLATPVAAVQLVSLQNDVWLTALFLYALVDCLLPAFGMLALTKPFGFLYALAAGATWRFDHVRITGALTVSIAAIGLWVVRDVILLQHAIVPIKSTEAAANVGSSIAAHLPHSALVLAIASWDRGLSWTALFGLGIAAIVFSPDARVRWAAAAATVFFSLVPTGYETGPVQQLATGASLRFGLPVAALGALWLLSWPPRLVPALTVCSAIAAGGVSWRSGGFFTTTPRRTTRRYLPFSQCWWPQVRYCFATCGFAWS
jgi:hypothetical protein